MVQLHLGPTLRCEFCEQCEFFRLCISRCCCKLRLWDLNFHLIPSLRFERNRGLSIYVFFSTWLVVSLKATKRQWWMGQGFSDWAEAVRTLLAIVLFAFLLVPSFSRLAIVRGVCLCVKVVFFSHSNLPLNNTCHKAANWPVFKSTSRWDVSGLVAPPRWVCESLLSHPVLQFPVSWSRHADLANYLWRALQVGRLGVSLSMERSVCPPNSGIVAT